MAVLTTFPADINAVDARDTLNAILARLGTLEGAGSGITLAISSAQIAEEGDAVTFTVTRSGNLAPAVLVNWSTAGNGSNPLNAADFPNGFPAGSFTIASNATSGTFTVQSAEDATVEPNETGVATISSPTANVTITAATAQFTFSNDDSTSTGYGPATVQDTGVQNTGSAAHVVSFEFKPQYLSALLILGLDASGQDAAIAVEQLSGVDNQYRAGTYVDGVFTPDVNQVRQLNAAQGDVIAVQINPNASVSLLKNGGVVSGWASTGAAGGTYARIISRTADAPLINARINSL